MQRACSSSLRAQRSRAVPWTAAKRVGSRGNRLDDFRQYLKGAAATFGRGGAGSALLAVLLQLLADALTLEIGKVVDEELAVEVIHLVLDADGENLLAVPLEEVAVAVLGTDTDPRGALHLLEIAGNGKAALLRGDLALPGQNLRVDEDQRIVVLGRDIDHQQALVHVDLRRGKANAGRGIHGLQHVIDDPVEVGIEPGDRLRPRT